MLAKFRSLSKERQGILIVFIGTFMWSFFAIVTVSLIKVLSPIFAAGLSTLLAALFFLIIMVWHDNVRELLYRQAWWSILMSTLLIGVLVYALFFLGYQMTTAGVGSIVSKLEVLFAFIFFGLILQTEKYTWSAMIGAFLMTFGVVVLLFQGEFDINIGSFLIMLGALLAPIGNFFQQKARKFVSAETLLFVRSFLGGIALLVVAYFYSPWPNPGTVYSVWPLLLINGVLLMGLSKLFWIESIHRISVTQGTSISTWAPVLTLVWAYFLLGEVPSWWQFIGLVPILVGTYLITNKNFLHTKLADTPE